MPDPTHQTTTRQLALLILVSTLLRLAFAATLGLGVDESYMVAAGRVVSLGYFDHPPAAWWLSWGAAHLFGSEAPVVVRLPFILLFALSTWLMARLGAAVASPRAGLWAAVLLNLSPVFGVTTGSWVLPDGPLDCALLGAVLCLMQTLDGRDSPGAARLAWWCGAGLCAGLALFSKYSALLTLAGGFLFLLISPAHRPWLRRKEPWLAAGLALLVFAPVVIWNATHGWASFAFQGDRAAGLRFRPLAPLTTLAGEALFVLPWIWLPMMALFIASLRGWSAPDRAAGGEAAAHALPAPHPRATPGSAAASAARPGEPDLARGSAQDDGRLWRRRLLACLAAPPIVVFALVSAWSGQRVLFHWAAPGYLMLFPLLGQAVVERLHRPWVRRIIAGTAALVIASVAVIGVQIRFDWLGPALVGLMRRDPTVEGVDWTSLRTALADRGLLRPGMLVGVPNWRDAGKIAYALGPGTTVICLSRDSRQFGFAAPAARFVGHDMLLLAVEPQDQAAATLSPLFRHLDTLSPVEIHTHGRNLAVVSVFRGETLIRWPPPDAGSPMPRRG